MAKHVTYSIIAGLLCCALDVQTLPSAIVNAQIPNVRWQPATLEISIVRGASRRVRLNFTVGSDIQSASLRVVPQISRILSLANASLGTLRGGSEYSVEAIFDVASSTPAATYKGTIHLESSARRSPGTSTIPRPLTVVIHVRAPTSQDIPAEILLPSSDRIASDPDGQLLVKDEIIVMLNADTDDPATAIIDVAELTGGVIVGSNRRALTYQLQYLVRNLEELELIRARVATAANVKAASHHYLTSASVAAPNDVDYADAWDEANPAGRNWHLEYVRAPSAWDLETGSRSVRVSIIDSDFDAGHDDLDDNVLSGPSLSLSSNRHGTHVAGIACAEGNNGIGVAGVAWECSLSLYPIATLDRLILTYVNSVVAAQEAMIEAVDATSNPHVVNMSLQWIDNNQCGTPGTATTLQKVAEVNAILEQPILYAHAAGKDVLWVFAAGNECRDVRYASPASLATKFSNAIAVASINEQGELSSFSNFGDSVSVAAPGDSIFSTLPRNCVLGICGSERYGELSGTSMAAPMVTGAAALVFSRNTGLSATGVKDCIVRSSESDGAQVPGQIFYVLDAPHAVACVSSSLVASSDSYTMTQGTTLTVPSPGNPNLLDNDTIPAGATGIFVDFGIGSGVYPPPPGSFTNLTNSGTPGGFIYQPPPTFVGTVTLHYYVGTTNFGNSNVVTVTITVNPVLSRNVTISSIDVPKNIPNPGQVVSTLTVGNIGTILDVTASFSFTHQCERDLVMVVRHPDGTGSTVMDRGLERCSGVDSLFTSTSLTMQNMLGKPAAGVWTITITDDNALFSGQLNSWSLNFRVPQ